MLSAAGAALIMLTATGCARGPQQVWAAQAGSVSPAAVTAKVVVQNNNTNDVNVYAVQSGDVYTRLGTVTALSSDTFTTDRSLFPTGALHLVALPIGGSGVARSGPVLVSGGQTVTFTIQPDLAASMATVY